MMLSLWVYIWVWVGLAIETAAIPVAPGELRYLQQKADNSSMKSYSLPELDDGPRTQAIEIKRQKFIYGPSPVGTRPFFPTGSLGDAKVHEDLLQDGQVLFAIGQKVAIDEGNALLAIKQAGGIKSLSDYKLLYEGQWSQSVPEGVDPGMLSNYTQDLLFSMERLSVNPFSVKRLSPTEDDLPFTMDNTIVIKLTGQTLESLYATGHLFYADHRAQANLTRTARYAAACDAYFYIHPKSLDFLPLAIRPNAGTDLIYTPLDQANDWLLAKMMFNNNDFWYANWYHFAGTHAVVEIVYEAAMRTLSNDHPILALLDRIAYQAFAYRIDAVTRLINPGGPIDTLFPFPGTAAAQFTDQLYNSGVGAFQAKYFYTDFSNRGLYQCSLGPELKHFPFFEDALVIHTHLTDFMASFINSYYSSDDKLTKDNELQAWIAEAVPAEVIDFPSAPLTERGTLIDTLTHLAYLATAVHHTLNTNDLIESFSTLPFHPASLYSPVPSTKNISSVLPWLPGSVPAISQIGLAAFFNRVMFANTNQTLAYLFDDPGTIARTNEETKKAAQEFKHAMNKMSHRVSRRKFDADGLSQGMPFVWKALDPQTAPFYLAT